MTVELEPRKGREDYANWFSVPWSTWDRILEVMKMAGCKELPIRLRNETVDESKCLEWADKIEKILPELKFYEIEELIYAGRNIDEAIEMFIKHASFYIPKKKLKIKRIGSNTLYTTLVDFIIFLRKCGGFICH